MKLDVEDLYLSIDTTIPLGLIINELVTNALKYTMAEIRVQYTSNLKE